MLDELAALGVHPTPREAVGPDAAWWRRFTLQSRGGGRDALVTSSRGPRVASDGRRYFFASRSAIQRFTWGYQLEA